MCTTATARGDSPVRGLYGGDTGTSGYSYNEWVGLVYPAGTNQKDFLSTYADLFPTVELNSRRELLIVIYPSLLLYFFYGL